MAANTCQWTGAGPDNRWSTAANWTTCGGVAPRNGDRISYVNGAARPVGVNDIAALSVLSFEIVGTGAGNARYDVSGLSVTTDSLGSESPNDGAGLGPIVRMPIVFTGLGIGIAVGDGTTLSMAGAVSSANGTVLKGGPGTLVLSSTANTWMLLHALEGTVRLGAAGVLPATAALETIDTTLDLNNFSQTIGSLRGLAGATPTLIKLGSATLTINQSTAQVFEGAITGTGNIIKNGAGQLAITGDATTANTYTGTTTVNAGLLILQKANNTTSIAGPIVITGGTLRLASDNQIADTVAITLTAPGVLDIASHKDTIGSLTGNGQVLIAKGTIGIGANNTSTTFDGTFFGDPGGAGLPEEGYFRIVKTGGGNLTLTGDSRLSDLLMIESGRLVLNGRINGAGALVKGGELSGSGTIFDSNGINTFVSNVTLRGGRIAGDNGGILHADAVQINQGAIDTFLAGAAPGTGFFQVDLKFGITLFPEAELNVLRGSFEAPVGAKFTIVNVAPGQTTSGTFAGLPEGATLLVKGQKFGITYRGGASQNSIVLTALEAAPPPPPVTYFLSEGATGGFFDEDVLIANPGDKAAPVTLTFSKENGEQVTATRSVPAQSHLTVHVDQIPGLEATAASAQVRSESGAELVVERTMFWDKSYYAGSTGSAVDRPQPDWFFAEGSQGFFDTFVLVNNPNATPTDVTFTFLRENDAPVVKTITVGATTRLTLHAGDLPDLVNRSFGIAVHATQPIMAERSMFFGTTATRLWSGGTESAGVTSASTHWFLAEGATGGFFDTFILLSNPNSTPAHVTLQYLLDTGETITVPKTIAANARLTTNIEAEDDVRLHNAAVSTVVTSDVPVIAERSMYWPGAAVPWGEGHNSFGVVNAGRLWGLAEGRTGGPLKFHTYILLANPAATAANVTVTYLRENGAPVTKTYTVPATSRFNIDTGTVAELHDESFGAVIAVTNNIDIIVERSMYWDSNGFQFSGGTNATGIRIGPS